MLLLEVTYKLPGGNSVSAFSLDNTDVMNLNEVLRYAGYPRIELRWREVRKDLGIVIVKDNSVRGKASSHYWVMKEWRDIEKGRYDKIELRVCVYCQESIESDV